MGAVLTDEHHDWIVSVGGSDPRKVAEAQATATDDSFSGDIVTVDLSQLAADLKEAGLLIDDALTAADAMNAAVASTKVDPNSPDDAAAALQKAVGPVPPAVKMALQGQLDQVNDQRAALVGLLGQMKGVLATMRRAQQVSDSLPKPVDEPAPPSDSTKGTDLEHAIDAYNGVLGLILSPTTGVIDVMRAVAGSDYLKDGVKALLDEVHQLDDQLKDVRKTLNATLAAVADNAAKELTDANTQLNVLNDSFGQTAVRYKTDIEHYQQAVATAIGPAPKAQAAAKPITDLYFAISAAGRAFEIAHSRLVSRTLSEKSFPAYFAQLVPPGKLQKDGIVTGGDSCFYVKNGKCYGYMFAEDKIAEFGELLKLVKGFFDSYAKIAPLAGQWEKAISAVL
jgi:hypothetical protein